MSTNKDLIEELQEQNQVLADTVSQLRTEMREGKTQVDRDLISEAISVLYDPYDIQSPFRILGDIPADDEFPDGQALRWLLPRYREGKWRGWKPLQWGDKYTGDGGEKLEGLISDSPVRMHGPDQLDSYVRRGDVILGRLDKRIWVSRQARRELEDARRRGQLRSNDKIKLGEGVYLTGEGIREDKDPKSRKRPSDPDVPFDKETGTGAHRTQLME